MKKPNLPAVDPQIASLCNELLQRLDAAHARQWKESGVPIAETTPRPLVSTLASARVTA
jgi:hypothetical protein